MTKREFINKIKRRINRNNALPVNLSTDEIEDIIADSKEWFFDNYNDSLRQFIAVIPYSLFKTAHYKETRYVELDSCIYSINEFTEISNGGLFNYKSGAAFIRQNILNNIYYANNADIVSYVAYMGFESVLENLKDNYISFDWNKNEHRIHVLGHEPRTDVLIYGYKKLDETKLFEDDLFRQYVEGQSRIAIGEILSVYDFSLPGGVGINVDAYISKGETILEEVKETVLNLNTPLWFMTF